MTKAKKISIVFAATLFSIAMSLSVIVTPFAVHAAAEQKSYASYNTKTGEVSYYDVLPKNSDGTHDMKDGEGGSDRCYDPTK